MNPWSRAEDDGAPALGAARSTLEEREDRELFQRRARALASAPPAARSPLARSSDVPRLADVLRLAGPPRGEHRGSRFVTFALAAACLAGVWTRLPTLQVQEIAPDEDPSASVAAVPPSGGGLMSRVDERLEEGERTFTLASSVALASTELPACVAEQAGYAPRVELPARLSCERGEREDLCSVAGP